MARQMPDMGIAAALNRAGKTTAKGHSWTRTRVAALRNIHGVAIHREGERAARGEATPDEAAERLAVSPATVRRLIVEGVLDREGSGPSRARGARPGLPQVR